MAAGQPFASADEVNHSAVAVLSYGYWTARFDRDPGVIGKTIFIRGVPFTVLGVAAPHFYGVDSGGTATDLWVPLQNRPELPAWGIPSATGRTIYSAPDWWAMMLMARLKPGISEKTSRQRAKPRLRARVVRNRWAAGTEQPSPRTAIGSGPWPGHSEQGLRRTAACAHGNGCARVSSSRASIS